MAATLANPLTWLYRKTGHRYPALFLTLELQSAFLIAAGSVALLSFYYDAGKDALLDVLLITFALTALVLVIVLRRGFRRFRPLTAWIAGDRGPAATAEAWRVAVSTPYELVRRDMWFPIFFVTLPVAVAALFIYDLNWLAFFPLLIAGLIALGYSGILHYLALELAMRPILFDINAALETPLHIDRPAVPLRVKLLGSLPLINVITGVTVAALTADGGGASALGINVLIALAVAFTISFELTVLLSRSILRPIGDLEAATVRIRQGRFDEHVPVTTSDEFGELSSAFNQMVDGLSERERLREAFGTYLDEEVARHIISSDYDPKGAEFEVSLLFCDVENFTGAAAEASAPEVVARLNELFEVVVPIVGRHRGHVDQFIGDGVLAVFGAPERMPDHADRAVQCAVELARTVNSRRPGGFRIGIGVNTGTVVAGAIGGAGRLSFSVIGDAVNVAARVEGCTRETGDPVLVTGETRAQLDETVEVRERGDFEIKGTGRKVELFAPLVPEAVRTGPGDDVKEVMGDGAASGLGRADDGLGLGQAPARGLGRSSGAPGGTGTRTLPGS
jgi:class 3 adenylate cyclase